MNRKLLSILVVSFLFLFQLMSSSYAAGCGILWLESCCKSVGDDCCSGSCDNGLDCVNGKCARPCGREGQPCCSGSGCNSNTLACESGTCRQICPKQILGCYAKNDDPKPTGQIRPRNYHYYLPENKCFRTENPPTPNPQGQSTSSTPTSTQPSPSPTTPPTSPGCPTGQIMCNNRCWNPACITDEDCGNQNYMCIRPGTCQAECINPNLDTFGNVVADITGNLIDCDPDFDQNCNQNPPSNPPPTSPSSPASNCVCRDSNENANYQTDPDESTQACGCVKGKFQDGMGCCGDDTLDCARQNQDMICSMPVSFDNGTSDWIDGSSNTGDTTFIPCAGTEFLSNGTGWLKCDEFFGNPANMKKTFLVGNHDYLCLGFGKGSVAECCGDGSCQSKDANVKKIKTGEIINPSKNFSSQPKPTFDILNFNAGYAPSQASVSSISNSITAMAVFGNQITGFQVAQPAQSSSASQCRGGVGSSCDAPEGNPRYQQAVSSAITSFLSSHPEVANAPNNNEVAVSAYLTGVADILKSSGYNAGRAINCNGNEGSDSVMVGRSGDPYGEYYDIILSSGNGVLIKDSGKVAYFERAGWSRLIPTTYTGFGSNVNYICRADGKFTRSLDNGFLGGASWQNPDKNEAACTRAGYIWTGTKCCGEPGNCEYYNDPGQRAGCWKSKQVLSGTYAEEAGKSVINYDGTFYGCAVAAENYNKSNNVYLGLLDKGTARQLITDRPYCSVDPRNLWFCSYREVWLTTNGKNRTHISYSPEQNPAQAAECCSPTECWNSTACIADQSNNPHAQPLNGKRCIAGEWVNAHLKWTPDESVSGYCPQESMCLLNPNSPQGNQCVNSGNYSNDNYCDNGVWSTRTKLVALKLLSMKSGAHTLFCDDRTNSLNNLQYMTENNEVVANILQNLGTNNFCVLKYSNQIVAGVSINRPIESAPPGSLNIFRVTSCSQAMANDGQYHPCDSSNKVWYNKKYNSLIYSSSAINVPSDSGPSARFSEFVGNPISFITQKIRSLVTPAPTADTYYVDKLKRFNKLYISENSGRTIRGVLEGKGISNMVIGYSGFSGNICHFVNSYNEANKDSSSGIACKSEGNNYYVLGQGTSATNVNPDLIWTDMTSKLRIT